MVGFVGISDQDIDSTVIYSLEGGGEDMCSRREWKNKGKICVHLVTGSMRENIASVKKRFP